MDDLYQRVKALCSEQGITIARLEKSCGIANATIRKWRDISPKLSTLERVADYFGVSIDFLVDRTKRREINV